MKINIWDNPVFESGNWNQWMETYEWMRLEQASIVLCLWKRDDDDDDDDDDGKTLYSQLYESIVVATCVAVWGCGHAQPNSNFRNEMLSPVMEYSGYEMETK
jgi:hypothetical protein